MNGINKVILLGHLGSDPQTHKAKNGQSFTHLRIATNKKYKNKQDQWEERPLWNSVTVWGSTSENCVKYLKKGQAVMVEGYVCNFEKESEKGQTEWVTGVTADRVDFLHKPNREKEASN